MTYYLKETPWDKRTLNIDTYELTSLDVEAFQETMDRDGHFTVKVDPFFDKKLLREYGFYYADTLLEPRCRSGELKVFEKDGVTLDSNGDKQVILDIAEHAFVHGRFHRDFHIPNELADLRYVRWLEDLYDQNQVYFLHYQGDLTGFFGFDSNKVLLLGIGKEFTGLGLAKPFLSSGCLKMLSLGYDELTTSISAINLSSLNLFQSLGFKLRGSVDVYHKLNGKTLME